MITHQTFYSEFLMTRGNFDAKDFGVDLTREEFIDQIVQNELFRLSVAKNYKGGFWRNRGTQKITLKIG